MSVATDLFQDVMAENYLCEAQEQKSPSSTILRSWCCLSLAPFLSSGVGGTPTTRIMMCLQMGFYQIDKFLSGAVNKQSQLCRFSSRVVGKCKTKRTESERISRFLSQSSAYYGLLRENDHGPCETTSHRSGLRRPHFPTPERKKKE